MSAKQKPLGTVGREKKFRVLLDAPFLGQLQSMKHKLSKTEQARGLRKALRSRKTPPWLKPAIRRYLRKLESRGTAKESEGTRVGG